MYQTFRIQNFRAFEDLMLTDLARINLIGGANNTGKTSVLEAIFLHSGDLPLRRLLKESKVSWRTLFHNFEVHHFIETTSDTHTTSLGFLALEDFASLKNEDQAVIEFIYRLDTSTVIELVKLIHPNNTNYFIRHDGHIRAIPPMFMPHPKTYYLVGGSIGGYDDYLRGFTRLTRNRQSETLVKTLKFLDNRISDLTYLDDGLNIDIAGLRQLIPITSLGGGVTTMIDITLAINENPDGIVLIDEIENGLYYEILPDIWRAIYQAAVEFNVQIFATTHSDEMISAAHQVFSQMPSYDFRYYRLQRTPDNQIKPIIYTQKKMQTAEEAAFEVR